MSELNDLETSIIADGKVDEAEVGKLRAVLLSDGKIDRVEAELLFRINDAVSTADNDPSWPAFFSESISAHVLEDDATPGVVSDEEAQYLNEKINKTGSVDAAERALLTVLKTKAKQPIPAALQSMFDSYLS